MPSELIELSGHIIDSWSLPRAWDLIMDRGGNFVLEEIRVGRRKTEPSYARLKVEAPNDEVLELILSELQQLGAALVHGEDAETVAVEQNGVLPAKFYSTTNLPTQVRLKGQWVTVEGIEMDVAVVIDRDNLRAFGKPMHEIARQMKETRARNGKILFVLGPAVIHTGAGRYVAELIRRDYVQVIFGGNAIVAHDVESALFGTSLGVNLRSGEQVENGHRNHLRAINAIRTVDSLEKTIETGLLHEGLTYEAMKRNVPMVLTGSIRDDGPMPGVINDMQEAQRRMRKEVQGVQMALMIASMLHAIATGNLLPSVVRTVVVDINPAVVTKLADRGSFQAAAVVTDAELFLRELVEALV